MNRVEKIGIFSGIVAFALLLAGAVSIAIFDYLPAAEQVAEDIISNRSGIVTGGVLGTMASFFMIWFAGASNRILRNQEGGEGTFSTIAFAGALAASIAMAVGFTAVVTTGTRAASDEGLSVVQAVTMYDFWSQAVSQTVGTGLAVFIAATSLVSIKGHLFPRWFDVASLILALGLFLPFAYIFLIPAMVWLTIISLRLYNVNGSIEPMAQSRPAAAGD